MAADDSGSAWRQVGTYLGLALAVPAAAVIGFAIGYTIDRHFGSGRIFSIVFLLMGFAAGLREVLRAVSRES
ncbi:MAG: AtpZ/AtpI family protein [Terriglobales bacterium]